MLPKSRQLIESSKSQLELKELPLQTHNPLMKLIPSVWYFIVSCCIFHIWRGFWCDLILFQSCVTGVTYLDQFTKILAAVMILTNIDWTFGKFTIDSTNKIGLSHDIISIYMINDIKISYATSHTNVVWWKGWELAHFLDPHFALNSVFDKSTFRSLK